MTPFIDTLKLGELKEPIFLSWGTLKFVMITKTD